MTSTPGARPPLPPEPFEPAVVELAVQTPLYRVHGNARGAVDFNPGVGRATRFAFFDDEGGDTVPVLYAAATEQAAVAETLLHDVPASGGLLAHDDYAARVMSRIVTQGSLRLAVFHGLGLRRLRVTPEQVTASPASTYVATVQWAQAAHRAGFDGVVWMSDTKIPCGGAGFSWLWSV